MQSMVLLVSHLISSFVDQTDWLVKVLITSGSFTFGYAYSPPTLSYTCTDDISRATLNGWIASNTAPESSRAAAIGVTNCRFSYLLASFTPYLCNQFWPTAVE